MASQHTTDNFKPDYIISYLENLIIWMSLVPGAEEVQLVKEHRGSQEGGGLLWPRTFSNTYNTA